MKLTIDGVDLQNYAWNIRDRGGRWTHPGRIGTNINVPGRHGTLWVRNKTFDENNITMQMWAVGCNPDGTFPTDRSQAQQCRDNLDALGRLFARTHNLMELIETDDLGVQRRCWAETYQAYDYSTVANGTRAEFAVELKVPATFWEDMASISFETATGLTTGTNFEVIGASGGSAPIDDSIIKVDGAVTNPKIIDLTTNDWVQYSGVLADGEQWVVDNNAWTTVKGATNLLGSTTHSGTRLLTLSPHPVTGLVSLRFEGSSTGANTKVTVIARRKWLLA